MSADKEDNLKLVIKLNDEDVESSAPTFRLCPIEEFIDSGYEESLMEAALFLRKEGKIHWAARIEDIAKIHWAARIEDIARFLEQ